MTKFGTTTFAYNDAGVRIRKGTTEYYAEGTRILAENRNGAMIYYSYDESGIAGFEYGGRRYYYRKNIQGDVTGIYDEFGTMLGGYNYDAWGKVLSQTANEIVTLNPFRYRGYYYDTETSLYYLNTRYYDPETGRFISPDSTDYLDPVSINGLNLYAYCGNNPVMNVDPEGKSAVLTIMTTFLIAVGAVAAGGAVVGGISAAINNENLGHGIINGLVAGAMFGFSIGLIATGIGAPAWVSSFLITAGVAGTFMLGANLNTQLQSNGFGKVDKMSMLQAWGAGTVFGGLAGTLGYAFGAIFTYAGQIAGLSLAGKTFLGVNISRLLSSTTLHWLGGAIGGFLAGQISGKIMKHITTDVGILDYTIPTWLATLITKIFKK